MPPAGVSGTPPNDAHSKRDTAVQLDESVLEPPGVDGDRFLDDVDQTGVAHLRGDEAGRRRSSGVPATRKPSGCDPNDSSRSTT